MLRTGYPGHSALYLTLVAGLLLMLSACAENEAGPTAEVYMTEGCQCCRVWADYLEDEGFSVEQHYVEQARLNEIKRDAGLDFGLSSCHSAKIEGYLVEGHVPAREIRYLLEERPDVSGIAVPGMPIGSPGMERGDQQDRYAVVSFDADGNTDIIATYPE